MPRRTCLVGCLALVLLARTVHCLHADVSLCADAAAARTDAPPLSDPNASDPNETGCICKGAVVVAPCLPADLEAQNARSVLAHLADFPSAMAAVVPTEPLAAFTFRPPPLPGKTVRALLASWQI